MVQEAAAPHLDSPIEGKQASSSVSSMWPVLALGILTAIFAWIWYRGSGERKEPETPVQKQDTAVTTETGQQNVQSKLRPLVASLASSEQESVQTSPGDASLASSEQESVQTKSSPGDASLASSEQESVQTSPLDTDLTRGESNLGDVEHDPCEYGVPCPKIQEKLLNPGIAPTETEERETSDVYPCGSDLEVQSNVIAKGNPSVSVQAEVKAADPFSDVTSKVHLEGDLQEHKDDQVLPGNIQECPTDVKEDLLQHLTDVTKQEELHDILQEPPTSVSVNEDKKLLKDVVHTNAESCPRLETHGSGVLDAGRTHLNGDQGFVVQANGEVACPTALAPEAQKVLSDSCNASSSDQGSGLGEDIVHQDEDYGNKRMNGADDEAENGPGGQLENSFFVKENGKNVLESGEALKQDLYPEINLSSDIECAIVTDKFSKDDSIETCDIKRTSNSSDTVKPSIKSHENTGVFDGSLNTSPEALCDFQNLGTYPESSSIEIYSMFNQEKGMPGLSSSNTNEKNSVYSPSEANINEVDNQKTKKVATIQPMPQNVNFGFKVHYITHSDSQIIAVTGDHEKLGKWETYVPLISGNGGFWSHSIILPADINVAWKFIMVENGKIKRWEECNNRLLKIAHEDIEGQLFWGYPCHKI